MARLRIDHARMSRVLREVEVQRAQLGTRPERARAVVGEALRYLVDYTHRHHHPREDRLYERLGRVRADLGGELRGLGREHEAEAARAHELAETLQALPTGKVQGRAGERFARELQSYVDATREHMRREERAVLYAGVEPWLSAEEWRALGDEVVPDDPLDDARYLRRHYPHLATALAEPIRDVSSADREPAPSADPRSRSLGVLREGAEELVDTYGGLLHEGLDLVRANVAALWRAPVPFGAVEVLPEVSRRSVRFATRCFTLPSRVAFECASRALTTWGAPEESSASDD